MKKLSVIIVNYNVSYFLEQSLLSVRKALSGIESEVFVVDNNSVDGSVEMVRSRFPEVILIANKDNVGFSKANNQAIRMANGEYVLLLNPDTVVEESTFSKCIQFMDTHLDGGGLGVKMIDGQGEFLPESKRGLPTPSVAFYKIFGLSALFPKSKIFGKYHLGYLDKKKIHEVEVLSGAFMFLRKKVLDEIGLLDEEYFMYGEDIDLSYRIIKAGYKNYYFPKTRIIHYKGESTKRTSINYVFVFYRAMIIFARKHFSGNQAGLFSLLINLAIYLRAGMAIFSRALKKSIPFISDFALIFLGMFFLKTYWENNHKYVPGEYPPEFMKLAVPGYTLFWLVSAYFSGSYDKPFKISKLVRGIIIGTVLISAISNFFDEYRFSKALIILGGIWAIIGVSARNLITHFVKYRNLWIGEKRQKRTVIVGSEEESRRVVELLKQVNVDLVVIGFVSTDPGERKFENFLGDLRQLSEVVRIYAIDEVIFCGKDIPSGKIIEQIVELNNRTLEFKILPEDSTFIIGSSSKNAQGDYYSFNVELNLYRKSHQRNKRLLDILSSLSFLILTPVLLWFVKEKYGFVRNCLGILAGKYSWVGLKHTVPHEKIGELASSILSPVDQFEAEMLNEQTIKKLEVLYAQEYDAAKDLYIIIKCFAKLGRLA